MHSVEGLPGLAPDACKFEGCARCPGRGITVSKHLVSALFASKDAARNRARRVADLVSHAGAGMLALCAAHVLLGPQRPGFVAAQSPLSALLVPRAMVLRPVNLGCKVLVTLLTDVC